MYPNIRITILSKAFIVKAINLGDLTNFVVSSKNSEPVFEANFKGYEERYCFNRIITSVDIIAHENIICFRNISTNSE